MEIRPVAPNALPTAGGAPVQAGPSTPSDRFETAAPAPGLMPRPEPRVQANQGVPAGELRQAVEAVLIPSHASPEAREAVTRDLASLPLPILRMLGQDGVRVALLAPGESLADTALLRRIPPEVYGQQLDRARGVLDQVVAAEVRVTEEELARDGGADSLRSEMARYWEGRRIADGLGPALREARLGFSVRHTTEPLDLDDLAAEQKVPAEQRGAWEEALRKVNGDHAQFAGGLARPKRNVLILPHTYYKGNPVAKPVLDGLQRVDSAHVERSLGLHVPEERLVILHQDYVTDPSPELGHYRIALHETGHAVDHALDRRLGAAHRSRVEKLFQADRDALGSGGPNRFLSPRAMDNAREYFAEAVEAYQTLPVGDGRDTFRTESNRESLRRLNPELHAYLGELFAA